MPDPFRNIKCLVFVFAIATSHAQLAAADDSKPAADSSPATPAGDDSATQQVETPRVSAQTARDRAQLLHDMYSATLDTMHHRYFHDDRAVVPARAMQDVFEELQRQHHIQARWISASFSPMSIDHEPKTAFEKQAARKLAKGEIVVETLEDGFYRRAGSIALTSGCVSCHNGLFASTSPTPKFAGLVISIPVLPNSVLEPAAKSKSP